MSIKYFAPPGTEENYNEISIFQAKRAAETLSPANKHKYQVEHKDIQANISVYALLNYCGPFPGTVIGWKDKGNSNDAKIGRLNGDKDSIKNIADLRHRCKNVAYKNYSAKYGLAFIDSGSSGTGLLSLAGCGAGGVGGAGGSSATKTCTLQSFHELLVGQDKRNFSHNWKSLIESGKI